MEEQKRLVFSAGDSALPLWFSGIIQKQEDSRLVFLLEEDQVILEGKPDHISAQYVYFDDEKAGVAVLCTVLSEDFPISRLFMVGEESLLPSLEKLSFLNEGIQGLDVCFTLISWFGEKASYLENFILCYQEKVAFIPGILTFEKVWLRIIKEGLSSHIVLAGEFTIGEDISLTAEFDFIPGSITGSLLSPDGAFPSFIDFLNWITKGIGAEELFGWLSDAGNILDVSLSAASLTLDTESFEITDYMVDAKVCLFGLDLEIRYFGAQRLLLGTSWKQQSLEFSELLKNLPDGYELPQELKKVKLSGCEVRVWTDKKEYELACRIEGKLTLGGISLTQVWVQLHAGEDIQLKIGGTAELSDCLQAEITVQYASGGKEYSMTGHLSLIKPLKLPEVPFLFDLLPGNMRYQYGGTAFIYESGRLEGGSLEFQVSSPQKKQPVLEASYGLLETPDGKLAVQKEEILPEKGPVRQDDGVRWHEINRRVAAAHLDRAGIGFSDMVLSVYLDGGVRLGPVDISVAGLSIGYDLGKKSVRGNLNGLLLACNTDAFSISGAVFRDLSPGEGIRMSFSGTVKVKLSKWGLQAIASYAVMEDGTVSFFVFLNASVFLQALPAIIITGIMGGLGINRRFRIPTAAEVESFPLLDISGKKDGMQVLAQLESAHALVPASGEYWAAAGMAFEACGLVKGKLLLAVLFGEEFQAALLGSAELTLPKGARRENAYAFLKIMLSAVLRPRAGIFQVEAVVSKDSFLLSKDCHLFGQAVCTVWFGENEHAGDFVLSIGGYHPAYRVPKHYPAVQPVGFSWQVDSHISAKGNAYMALTPSCIMAGGNLEFLFTLGNLRAWFTARANLLIGWHPFYFDAQLGVEIGVSYRLNLLFCHKTLRVSLSADLHLWGPPIGGYLKVHLSFLSFSISFGKSQGSGKRALTWQEMRETLLKPGSLHTMEALEGIRPQRKEKDPWIADGGRLTFLCSTAVPAGHLHIRPMELTDVDSVWEMHVTAPDGRKGLPESFGFIVSEEKKKLPGALWGRPGNAALDEKLVEGLASGYRIEIPAPQFSGEIQILNYRDALVRCLHLDNPFLIPEASAESVLCGQESGETLELLAQTGLEDAVKRRNTLIDCMNSYYQGPAGTFQRVQRERMHLYADCPLCL